MARDGMSELITTLRGMGNAGTADYTAAGTTWWGDDQIQAVLDRHRAELNNVYASPIPRMVNGSAQYLDYYVGSGNLEGGTVYFAVENGVGVAYGTALYSVDYARGIITFAADNAGGAVSITGRSYDLNAAAADLWRQKASSVASAYDFRTDNHSMSRSQMMKQYLMMAEMYEGMGGVTANKIERNDTYGGYQYADFDRD